jgi:hypothetical protein
VGTNQRIAQTGNGDVCSLKERRGGAPRSGPLHRRRVPFALSSRELLDSINGRTRFKVDEVHRKGLFDVNLSLSVSFEKRNPADEQPRWRWKFLLNEMACGCVRFLFYSAGS